MKPETGISHEHSENVVQAAQWLADQATTPQPIINILRQRFALTPIEACEATALAKSYQTVRRAFS